MSKPTVAILGLGTMGGGMANNLLKAGFPLTVYNRTAAKAAPLAALGAHVAATPKEAAHGADIIVSMLADDVASRAAWLGVDGNAGALAASKPGAILIESSTVTPGWIAELGAAAAAHGVELIDAPVTGSRTHAEAGQLNFLVGGSADALIAANPVLQAMAKDVIYIGPLGSGAKLKLVNNFICGVQAASLAEGLAWIERSGLDRDKALDVLKGGAPGSPLLGAISARMTSRSYGVNFLLKLMCKDLRYAQDAAGETGVELTTAANAQSIFERAIEQGYGEQDMAAVIEPLRKSQGGQS